MSVGKPVSTRNVSPIVCVGALCRVELSNGDCLTGRDDECSNTSPHSMPILVLCCVVFYAIPLQTLIGGF